MVINGEKNKPEKKGIGSGNASFEQRVVKQGLSKRGSI